MFVILLVLAGSKGYKKTTTFIVFVSSKDRRDETLHPSSLPRSRFIGLQEAFYLYEYLWFHHRNNEGDFRIASAGVMRSVSSRKWS